MLKNNKKRTIIILSSAILGIALITAFLIIFVFNIICFHEWQDATCTSPKTCIKCSQTSGEKLEHSWSAATCEMPEMCSVCGEIRAEAMGHDWTKADCENPKICNTCKKTDGQALGHDWAAATCDTPKTCKNCHETDGKALGHEWIAASCETPKTCMICGKKDGAAKGHNWLEATYSSPETCSVCGETRGEALTSSSVFSESQLNSLKQKLGVPAELNVEYSIGDVYLWEGTGLYMIPVQIIYQGKTIAGADVDANTCEASRCIYHYGSL